MEQTGTTSEMKKTACVKISLEEGAGLDRSEGKNNVWNVVSEMAEGNSDLYKEYNYRFLLWGIIGLVTDQHPCKTGCIYIIYNIEKMNALKVY